MNIPSLKKSCDSCYLKMQHNHPQMLYFIFNYGIMILLICSIFRVKYESYLHKSNKINKL